MNPLRLVLVRNYIYWLVYCIWSELGFFFACPHIPNNTFEDGNTSLHYYTYTSIEMDYCNKQMHISTVVIVYNVSQTFCTSAQCSPLPRLSTNIAFVHAGNLPENSMALFLQCVQQSKDIRYIQILFTVLLTLQTNTPQSLEFSCLGVQITTQDVTECLQNLVYFFNIQAYQHSVSL